MPLTPLKGKRKRTRDYLEFEKHPLPQEQEADPGPLGQLWARVVEPASYPWIMYLLKTDLMGHHSFWMRGLHRVNLVFHEFGHPAFSFFGRTMGILGGTLGQLLIPLVVTVAFWRQRDTLGCAVGGFWFFENFLDVAVYMADAQVLLLPLIGGLGGEAHDWRNLFVTFGVLDKTLLIAGVTNTLGWIGIFATWAWLGWRWLCSKST
jgi:hypothetical protein